MFRPIPKNVKDPLARVLVRLIRAQTTEAGKANTERFKQALRDRDEEKTRKEYARG